LFFFFIEIISIFFVVIQTNKLCTIAANIWGTRFKFYGHAHCLPEVLGSVTYKTSFLHLQPRQMTVTVANNYNQRKPTTSIQPKKKIKIKQQLRTKLHEEEDDENVNDISSSKLNIAANIPIAPMSPQLSNVHSSSNHENRSSNPMKKSVQTSPLSAHRLQRMSLTTTTASNCSHHRPRQPNPDSSTANSSSTSPINLSRSTSPAASIANFIRPISPPCIQVKEPLSPKFSRASSTIVANRHCSPPNTQVSVPSIVNNIDASTASATTTLIIDDSSGYDSSENQTNRIRQSNPITSIISTVPENCFEPETYRNLHIFNSNQQKKLSLSDPTLNQTTKIPRHSQSQTTTPKQISKDEEDIQTDDESENINSTEQTITTDDNHFRKVHTKNLHRNIFFN